MWMLAAPFLTSPTPVGELGTKLPSNLRRFWDSDEFGEISKIEPSGAFCLENSEERGLNFHEM
jgi:hypothetical protein